MEKVAHFFSFKTAKTRWMKISSQLLLVGILLAATFLRLYRIGDYMTFLGDEGRDVLIVYNILHGKFTLLGPTASVGGFFLGPIYYYFMAPFLWIFNYDPTGPAVMVGLFGVATVFLVYYVGKEFFSKQAGLIAALLYTISPLVIAYSRSSWNPNLMPFFSLLTLYVLYKAVSKNSKKLFIFSGFLFGILMQLHYIALFIGAIIVTYVLIIRTIEKNKSFVSKILQSFKDGIFILLGFMIGLAPFFAFEARHGFPNAKSIFNFIFHSEEVSGGGNFFAILGEVYFRLFARLITKYPPPEQVSLQAHFNIAIWYYLTLVLALFSLSVFLFAYWKSIKDRSDNFKKLTLLSVWFFLGIFIFGFYKKPIYDYYFGFLFPIPFLLIGNALAFLISHKNTNFRTLAIASFLLLVIINLSGIPFRFSPNRQKAQVEKIAQFVVEKTDRKPFNFALITGGNSDHAYRYFMRLLDRDPVTILNPQTDPKRKSVTDQLLIVCEIATCAPLGHPVWEIAGFGRAEIKGAWNVSVLRVYKLVPYK